MSVRGLSRSFGALRVTNDMTFDVIRGEILGVIGPNGAGKTTLFGLLAGTVAAGGGSIEYEGDDITKMPPHERARRGIGRTYQIPRPFGHMTVYENLMTAARFGGDLSHAAAIGRVDQVLGQTGMARHQDTLAGRLPLLLRKRHELARALAIGPRLLLVDEVAAGLTDEEVDGFIGLIQRIRASGVTVVWIEHVIKTMVTATDRLLALHAGSLLAAGPPADVIALPEVRRVYLGA